MGAAVGNQSSDAQTGNPQQPGGPDGSANRARFNVRRVKNGSARQRSGGTTSIMLP
jgi:hypothetical protein